MYNNALITFDFWDIRNNQGLGKCYQPRSSAWLITLTSTFRILQKLHPTIFYYCSFKIFRRFLLVKTTRIIHHKRHCWPNGKNFVILNRWRQNDIKSAAWLQVKELLTKKTWGRRSVVLVMTTKWLISRRNILLVSWRKSEYQHAKNSMKTNDSCYLKYSCRPKQTFIS